MPIRASRLEQIEEAMADLEAVFADPDCFHSPGSCDPRPVQDYAISLASEFVGEYHDDLIPARLARLTEAEDVGVIEGGATTPDIRAAQGGKQAS